MAAQAIVCERTWVLVSRDEGEEGEGEGEAIYLDEDGCWDGDPNSAREFTAEQRAKFWDGELPGNWEWCERERGSRE